MRVLEQFFNFHIYTHTNNGIYMGKSSSFPDVSNVRWPKVFSCCAVACVILLAVRRKASDPMAQQWDSHRALFGHLLCGKIFAGLKRLFVKNPKVLPRSTLGLSISVTHVLALVTCVLALACWHLLQCIFDLLPLNIYSWGHHPLKCVFKALANALETVGPHLWEMKRMHFSE